MKAKVTEKGLLIPRRVLKGAKEAEIKEENGIILVIPIKEDDPIYKLGKNPVNISVQDASVKHDKYLYGK